MLVEDVVRVAINVKLLRLCDVREGIEYERQARENSRRFLAERRRSPPRQHAKKQRTHARAPTSTGLFPILSSYYNESPSQLDSRARPVCS